MKPKAPLPVVPDGKTITATPSIKEQPPVTQALPEEKFVELPNVKQLKKTVLPGPVLMPVIPTVSKAADEGQVDDIRRLVIKAKKMGVKTRQPSRAGKRTNRELRRRVAELEYRQNRAVSWPTILCMTTVLAYAALFHFVIFRQ